MPQKKELDNMSFLDHVLEALEPLAAIADAFDNNELDEVRPGREADEPLLADPASVGLFAGRGGMRLLTLGDCLHARAVRDELNTTGALKEGNTIELIVRDWFTGKIEGTITGRITKGTPNIEEL